MSVLRRQFRLWPDDEPAGDISSLERLVTFLEANGYERVPEDVRPLGDDSMATSLQRPAAEAEHLFVRGDSGAGWWSSDQTSLRSLVAIYERDEELEAQWAVDTSGQWISEEDDDFWDREVAHARRAAEGNLDETPDFRDREARRSDRVRRRAVTTGIWAAVLVFFAIIALALLGII